MDVYEFLEKRRAIKKIKKEELFSFKWRAAPLFTSILL